MNLQRRFFCLCAILGLASALPPMARADDDIMAMFEPPIDMIVQWARMSKVKPISVALVFQHSPTSREAALVVYSATKEIEVMRNPPIVLLDACQQYLEMFKKEDGTKPSQLFVAFRDGGDYASTLSYAQEGFPKGRKFEAVTDSEFDTQAKDFMPPPN